MRPIQITDTTLRDGHQSLWATRMETSDMVPILPKMDKVGYWAMEAWGGATFDTCLRFLDENPWERLRTIKKHAPNTPLKMLTRGQNLVGYKHYSDEIVHRFTAASYRNGLEVFRVFDALNDIRNVKSSAEAILEAGGHFQGTISYTISPVHTIDSFVEYAQQLKELGAHSICCKDMAGMMTPYVTEELVTKLKKEVGLPVQLHCHYIGGMAPMNYLKGIEAGADTIDTAVVALAFGNSQPAGETLVAALRDTQYDTGLDFDKLIEIAEYWEGVRTAKGYKRGTTSLLSLEVYSHQVPGGMMSNLVSQLEIQNASERLPEVLKEIPKVRAEVGYPPLVTPMSQIVGTQSVLNVLTGKRWSIVPQEMRDYVLGYYGLPPAPINEDVLAKVIKDSGKEPLDPSIAPGSLVTTTYAEVEEEIGDLAKSEEDVLMYALFPNEARAYLERHHGDVEDKIFMTGDEANVDREDEETMDVRHIETLIKALDSSGVAEVVISEGDSQVALRKANAPGTAPAVPAAAPVAVPAPTVAPAPVVEAAPAPVTEVAADERPANWIAVTAPMVGTFYDKPSPESAPFVAVGDTVKAGDAVCILEAMKLMSEITVEEDSVVREILCESGDALGFGDVIMYVEPA
ncbi:MAG: acetyl-CoA carboxylase biotin carboxyl carrier protein [Coriobacteriia bacterium]|nr:acetyl-CoA carboxylase biotin carboxyl carrier protein [Coriobacteriia bacterium]MCL2871108.1 acetyl-CoA carboxylase biotin carboxyl carrier protein [Coriobacteriia bacterium]